ncbi:MAG: hypothetical protein U1D55_15035 [Phycisphaerae bacterium]
MSYGALKRPKDGIHKSVEGDTISSIGALYGFTDWENKLWNAGENSQLKTERVNPNTLVPGDQVTIPEKEQKTEPRPTDDWHDFHVVRNKRFLRLKLQTEDGKPMANRPYKIEARPTFRGTFVQQGAATTAEGVIEEEIPHTLLEADLVLPEDNLRCHLQIGYLRPLPMTDPIKSPELNVGGAASGVLDAVKGGAGGLLDAAKGAAGGLMGSATGAFSGAASGGFSASTSGGGMSAGGGLSGAANAAGGLAGAAKGAAGGLAKAALASASGVAGAAVKAVAGIFGDGAFPSDTDPNVYPSAQRLNSMGFDPGEPKNNKKTPQFNAAVMAFQAWCKEQGSMPPDAGGPLGGLTSPGGLLSGGAGPLGDIAGAVIGPVLAGVGLTGQLDQPTIDAIKKMHGC